MTAFAADQDQLDRLSVLMAGQFDNRAAISAGHAGEDEFLSDWRQRIEAPLLGSTVFYLQLNRGENQDLYRQRILVLSLDTETNSIKQSAHTLKNPEKFVNAKSASNAFKALGPDDVDRMLDDGCAQYWTETANGFSG